METACPQAVLLETALPSGRWEKRGHIFPLWHEGRAGSIEEMRRMGEPKNCTALESNQQPSD
jgi:hypothetical protein